VTRRILFVCERNSNRSQMAEALTGVWARGAVHAYSAGIAPAREVERQAIEVMRELGYDLGGHRPTPVTAYAADHFDVMVLIDCEPPPAPRAGRVESWRNIPDPTEGAPDVFRVVRDALAERVRLLLGPRVTITRNPQSVKAALLASQAKPVPMKVAASLAHHVLPGKRAQEMPQALNQAAAELSRAGDVYYRTATGRLRRVAPEDLSGGWFEDGAAIFRSADGSTLTSLSMRRGELLDAISTLKQARTALRAAAETPRERT
jgi:protein-tyrosine-phosphatase